MQIVGETKLTDLKYITNNYLTLSINIIIQDIFFTGTVMVYCRWSHYDIIMIIVLLFIWLQHMAKLTQIPICIQWYKTLLQWYHNTVILKSESNLLFTSNAIQIVKGEPNLCNSCNMAMRDLPDMYVQSLRAALHITLFLPVVWIPQVNVTLVHKVISTNG